MSDDPVDVLIIGAGEPTSGLITPSLDEMVHVAKEMEAADYYRTLLLALYSTIPLDKLPAPGVLRCDAHARAPTYY